MLTTQGNCLKPAVLDITDHEVADRVCDEKLPLAMVGAKSAFVVGRLLNSTRKRVCIKVLGRDFISEEFACVAPDTRVEFAYPGDSGALVFTKNNPQSVVGLVFAVSMFNPKCGFITPIQEIVNDCRDNFQVNISF